MMTASLPVKQHPRSSDTYGRGRQDAAMSRQHGFHPPSRPQRRLAKLRTLQCGAAPTRLALWGHASGRLCRCWLPLTRKYFNIAGRAGKNVLSTRQQSFADTSQLSNDCEQSGNWDAPLHTSAHIGIVLRPQRMLQPYPSTRQLRT